MSDFDPTGILSATTAGVRLVGAVLDVKKKIENSNGASAANVQSFARGPGESDVTGASTTAPATAAQIQSLALQRVDPERETRAYETVNFVLRTIGSRILEANMVNMGALATALTAATSHIEVKLFSGETNRLFQSLARKLNDVDLVNSVFTSIYLVGFLTAELTSSLPNYKREYPALGPLMVQQMMRVAIGDDAFRENQTANLNAYQTVATTAGLLKPTDIGYSIFPEFPSFSPTKYSSKSILDRNSHKGVLDKLVKHFEQYGFPQPLQGRDVGPIRDWRFLSSDSNSRAFEVDKADKQIGSQWGRVLYWLICSAHRMPSGMAVVAYYDQHIALIRYLGPRFGYRVLNTGGDLNMSGPHLQLNKKLRATFDTWVVIMPSESLIAERHKASQMAAQQAAFQASQPQNSQPQNTQHPTMPMPSGFHQSPMAGPGPQQQHMVNSPAAGPGPSQPHTTAMPTSYPQNGVVPHSPGSGAGRLSIGSEMSSQDSKLAFRPAANVDQSHQLGLSGNTKLNQLSSLEHSYMMMFQERRNRFISSPPTNTENLKEEYDRLTKDVQFGILVKIDTLDTTNDEAAGLKKKGLSEAIKGDLTKIDAVYREALAASSPPSRPSSVASVPSVKPSPSVNQALFGTISGPSELAGSTVSNVNPLAQELPANMDSPMETSNTTANLPTTQMPSPTSVSPITVPTPPSSSPAPAPSGIVSRPSVIRRKAPPPPKKVILAKALYDFGPEDEEDDGELTFNEGDIIEIVEKSKQLEEDGWCRARVKGQKKIGLAPLDYLEELPNQPSGPPARPSRVSSTSTNTTILEQVETQPDLNVSKPDPQVDIKVSSADQKPPSTPNAASPTIQQQTRPILDQKPSSGVLNPIDEDNTTTLPEQPPPSYDAAISQSSISATFTTTPQEPSIASVSSETQNLPAKPSSQATSLPDQANKPPIHPTQPLAQSTQHVQQPPYGHPSKPQQHSGQYQPSNAQNFQPSPVSIMPQNPYGRPLIYGGGPYAMPTMNPGAMSHGGGFGGNLHSYVGLAEAASGFAQAGSHIFAATHGHSDNHEPEYHHESHSNNAEHANDQVGDIINNTNNLNQVINLASNNNSNSTSSENTNTDNNQSISNSYSQNGQDSSYDGFSSAIPTFYPPESSTVNVPSLGNGYDYSLPYFPPETTTTSNPNPSSASPTQDPTYGTMTTSPEGRVIPSSSSTGDPNTYATAGSSSFDFGFSSTPNQETGVVTGTTSPFANLTTSPVPDSTQYPTGPDLSTGTSISPLASLATPGGSDSYGATSTIYTQFDSSQAVSPFASLATSSSNVGFSSDSLTAGTVSPLASLALSNTNNSSGGYFDTSTTVTVTADTTSNTTSPLAGLASSSSIDVTSTTTTTTDLQYGYGNIYSGNTAIDTSTTTTVDFSSNNGGGWNSTDYTVTDSTSYDYSGSFDF